MKSFAEDIELLQRLSAGDSQSLNELFSKYWKDLYSHALKITRDEHAADEIVQELFVRLWTKRSKLCIKDLSHYLFMSVRNGSVDYLRSELRRDRCRSQYGESMPAVIGSPEEEYLKTKVFEKNKMEGLTASQIAQSLNLSKRSVEYRLAAIKKYLKKGFSEFLLVIFFSHSMGASQIFWAIGLQAENPLFSPPKFLPYCPPPPPPPPLRGAY